MMDVIFHGVRGSFPTSSPATRRYGGSAAAVELHVAGDAPLLRARGSGLPLIDASGDEPFQAAALVTHLHLGRIQGLPFFPLVHRVGPRFDVYGPRQASGSLRDAFAGNI